MPSTLGRASTDATTDNRPVERVLLIVLALALAAAWLWLVQDQPRVSLTIDNPGPCPVWVAVARADGSGNINIGQVASRTARTDPTLLDRGAVYHFRFALDGVVVATSSVNRSDLEAQGWRYTVPSRPELSSADCAAP